MKQLYTISSPSSVKPVFDKPKPERKDYQGLKYVSELMKWVKERDEAERPIKIAPELLEIKEGDRVKVDYEKAHPDVRDGIEYPWGIVTETKEFAPKDLDLPFYEAEIEWESGHLSNPWFTDLLTKYPLNAKCECVITEGVVTDIKIIDNA